MDITYILEAGKRVVASKFNTNFNDVKTAVDTLETDVADLQSEASNVILPDGSKDFTNLQSYKANAINNATNATPIVITAVAHGYTTGNKVFIKDVGGNTAANGEFTITRLTADTFSLNSSVGNGAYTSGGTAIIYPMDDENLVNKQYIGNYSKTLNPTLDTSNMPTLANNVSDANNDIDFSAGFCYDTSTLAKITNIALTKRLDATFVAGTNQGGLDAGSKAINTWYHCFAISKTDETADFLYSLSPTAPTMPSGYINKRRIASIRTNASGNILGFLQFGNTFKWNNTITELASASWSTTPTDLVLTTPLGVISQALLNYHVGAGTSASHYIKEKLSGQIILLNKVETGGSQSTGLVNVFTDTVSAIQPYAIGSAFVTSTIYSLGYIDSRGVN